MTSPKVIYGIVDLSFSELGLSVAQSSTTVTHHRPSSRIPFFIFFFSASIFSPPVFHWPDLISVNGEMTFGRPIY